MDDQENKVLLKKDSTEETTSFAPKPGDVVRISIFGLTPKGFSVDMAMPAKGEA